MSIAASFPAAGSTPGGAPPGSPDDPIWWLSWIRLYLPQGSTQWVDGTLELAVWTPALAPGVSLDGEGILEIYSAHWSIDDHGKGNGFAFDCDQLNQKFNPIAKLASPAKPTLSETATLLGFTGTSASRAGTMANYIGCILDSVALEQRRKSHSPLRRAFRKLVHIRR